jgi:hypothetical protein
MGKGPGGSGRRAIAVRSSEGMVLGYTAGRTGPAFQTRRGAEGFIRRQHKAMRAAGGNPFAPAGGGRGRAGRRTGGRYSRGTPEGRAAHAMRQERRSEFMRRVFG